MRTEITPITKSKQENWNKNPNFCIVTYNTSRDNLPGPTINLLVSHQKWMEKRNEAPPNTKAIIIYIEQNGQKFIEEKIKTGKIIFSDRPSPELEPKYYEIPIK